MCWSSGRALRIVEDVFFNPGWASVNHSNHHRMKQSQKTRRYIDNHSKLMLRRFSLPENSKYRNYAVFCWDHAGSAPHTGPIKPRPTERCCLSEKTIRMACIKPTVQRYRYAHASSHRRDVSSYSNKPGRILSQCKLWKDLKMEHEYQNTKQQIVLTKQLHTFINWNA